MESYIGPIVVVGLTALGGLVWLVRLEGRVNTEAQLRNALQARLDGFEGRIYEVLRRIEDKLDQKADK